MITCLALLGILLTSTAADADSIACAQPHRPGAPIAILDGNPISIEDVQSDIAFQIYRLQVDIYSLLRRATEELIERRLLDAEAAERGLSVDELLEAQARDGAAPVTDEDVDRYFAENPQAAKQPNARGRIRYYLDEKAKIEARLRFLAGLRSDAEVEFLMKPPCQPRVRLDVKGAPSRGPDDAPVTIVHFGSFSSPRSVRTFDYLSRLQAKFPGRLRWVHRHFPGQHDELALAAAQLAVRAHKIGRFWDLHDRLFSLQGRLTVEELRHAASDLELELVEIGVVSDLGPVKNDIDAAVRAGIRDESAMFINGRYFNATFPYQALEAIVAEELMASAPD